MISMRSYEKSDVAVKVEHLCCGLRTWTTPSLCQLSACLLQWFWLFSRSRSWVSGSPAAGCGSCRRKRSTALPFQKLRAGGFLLDSWQRKGLTRLWSISAGFLESTALQNSAQTLIKLTRLLLHRPWSACSGVFDWALRNPAESCDSLHLWFLC